MVVSFLLSFSALAHSGRTDSNGGHNSSSGYHYHHGYSAHQHINGECPYDFDDKTGTNSGFSSSSSSSSYNSSSESSDKKKIDSLEDEIESLESELHTAKKDLDKNKSKHSKVVSIGIFLLVCLLAYLSYVLHDRKEISQLNNRYTSELNDYKTRNKELLALTSKSNKLLKSSEFELKKQHKTIEQLRSRALTAPHNFNINNYIYTAINDYELNILCEKYCEHVCHQYKQKGYDTKIVAHNDRFEKYMIAQTSEKKLLIQCVYTGAAPYLNEPSVLALFLTKTNLSLYRTEDLLPVLITNSELTAGAKILADKLEITYKENYELK